MQLTLTVPYQACDGVVNDLLQHHELACSSPHDVDSWELGILYVRYVELRSTGLPCHFSLIPCRGSALHELVDGHHKLRLWRRNVLRFHYDRLELLHHRWHQSCRLTPRLEHG